MNSIQLFDPASSTYTYLLFDESTRDALIIDPVDDQLERDLGVLRQFGLKLVWTLETHAHADHITSAGSLAEHAGAKTAAPDGCGITTAAVQLKDGDTLRFGSEQIRALHTPGHTAGSMSYLWLPDPGHKRGHRRATDTGHVFTGDTLLINGCGRTDFQSGSSADLYRSITTVLFTLPEPTQVWPGHDYNGKTRSTIEIEKTSNVRIAGKSLEQFVATMDSLKLPKPKRLDEAVPANQTSGIRHDATPREGTPAPDPQPRAAQGYAGDISPPLAWQWSQSGNALLIDIRTEAERDWVGFVPGVPFVPWKNWPGMAVSSGFDEQLKAAAPPGTCVLLLCRSGIRSIAAAKRATELGFEAYNILEGFEGDPDTEAHRGFRGGWRFHGLPWRQG
jgi:sulfur dioxygenase